MSQDDRSVGECVINIDVPVNIRNPGALSAFVKKRDRAFTVTDIAKITADSAREIVAPKSNSFLDLSNFSVMAKPGVIRAEFYSVFLVVHLHEQRMFH